MSRSIKLSQPPQFTVEIVDDALERLTTLLETLSQQLVAAGSEIGAWGSAVASAGWEVASLGQWLGLEGEAVLLLGGASYPEVAEHQGTSQSNVYNRVGKSLTLAPYARAAGAVTRVSAEALDQARREYALDDPAAGHDSTSASTGSLAERIPELLGAGALQTTEIAAALEDYRRSSVLSTLSLLARQGRIVRVGHGRYALPTEGRPAHDESSV